MTDKINELKIELADIELDLKHYNEKFESIKKQIAIFNKEFTDRNDVRECLEAEKDVQQKITEIMNHKYGIVVAIEKLS